MLDDRHFRWILANPAEVFAETGEKPPVFGESDEQPCRLWALEHGFTRIVYRINGGRLLVEASTRHYGHREQVVVDALVRANSDLVDSVEVRLLSPTGAVQSRAVLDKNTWPAG